MKKNASDALIDTIIDWGVDTVFGLPGDVINGIMEAIRVRQDRIRFIQVRHEEAAAFMACGYAKYTGRLGCCLATSGPGGIHLLNGLYDAKSDQAPVLAITGQIYSDLKGSYFQQEVNMRALFQDVAVYNEEVINPSQIDIVANEACRHALSQRGVAHITFPVDYQVESMNGKRTMHKRTGAQEGAWAAPRAVPDSNQLRQAADILNAAVKPVILIGQGALGAAPEVLDIADRLGAPIVKALLGKAVIADDHPLTTGGLGLLGTAPSQEAMETCDTILIIGSSFPYMEFLPKHDQAKGVQIDDKADRIGLRFPVQIGLVGDAKITLQALLPYIHRNDDRNFLQQAQSSVREWREQLKTDAELITDPIKPQTVAWELSKVAADDAIISGDSGTNTVFLARYFSAKPGQLFSCSGTLASMGSGLPYAIAAKIAHPQRESIAFVGDGGFSMLMADFVTAVKYHLPIVVVVLKNNTLGQIKWEQLVFLGNPEFGCDLQPIDFAKFAEACGGVGIKVDRPESLRPSLEIALGLGRPVVVEVPVDPDVPPMPPKIKAKQAANFAKALAKGTPGRGRIALTIFRDKLNELI